MEEVKTYIGIDPGLTGCIVAMSALDNNIISHHNVSCIGDMIDVCGIMKFLRQFNPSDTLVIVENPHVHQGDGIKTVFAGFRYGYSVGTLQVIPQVLGFNTTLVTPITWKSYYKLTGGKLTYIERKEKSVELACSFTGCDDDFKLIKEQGRTLRTILLHDKAEAYLLAKYLKEKQQ